MRGKIVNLCLGFMNLLFGILIVAFTIHVPQDKTLLTVQENFVVLWIVRAMYLIMTMVAVIDAIQSYNHRSDTIFNTGYIIGIFTISFIFIKEPIIAAFSIISGLIILFKSLKENLVELDSTVAISISIVVMAATAIVGIFTLTYSSIGQSIKNKENKNELSYKQDYFKYVTELGIDEAYINVKKDGKYGYINQNGEVKIDFIYDYASPFVEITVYDKKFHIALVCNNGSTEIILKNKRKVMSYRSESSDENYKAKLEELQNIYTNTLNQKEKMRYEIQEITNNITRVPEYKVASSEYTYRYDYNEEYDLIVTQSNLGLGDKYELAKKSDLNIRIPLDTTYLDYDSSYLYLFSNKTIPFYEISKRTQGWFTSYGKKMPMTGKAQILDFFEERMLIKNYSNDTTYFIDSDGNILSEEYKDIYVCNDGRYIVRTKQDSAKIINNEYEKVFDAEYQALNPRFITQNLYLALDSTENIEFNDYGFPVNLSWKLVNYNGEVIFDGIEQIYDIVYELPNTSNKKEEIYSEFINNLKELNYKFVGDRFYLDY